VKEQEIRNAEVHKRYLEMVRADAAHFFSSPESLENVACPACGTGRFRPEFDKFGFTYGTCGQCRTLYVNPRPKVEPLKDFYVNSPSSRYWVEKFFEPVAEARREKIFRPRAAYVAESLPMLANGMIGDIGAGYGLFLEELRRLWPRAKLVAIEPSPNMAKICRGKGLEVDEATIEDLDERDGCFSLLTAFELLEHLHKPESMISKAFRLLLPGGCLLLSTLSGEGFDIQLMWDKSRSIFPPHHLNFLNPESLSLLCRNSGFLVKALDTPGVLDWQIVEGAANRSEITLDRFWSHLNLYADQECKGDLQLWITKHRLSSHMQILLQRPIK